MDKEEFDTKCKKLYNDVISKNPNYVYVLTYYYDDWVRDYKFNSYEIINSALFGEGVELYLDKKLQYDIYFADNILGLGVTYE